MSTGFIIQSILESLAVIAIIIMIYKEKSLIAFEDAIIIKLKSKFKDIKEKYHNNITH